MKTFNDLTGLYSLSKTLQFELKPITDVSNIAKELIKRDEERNALASQMKDLMNELHKSFIDHILSQLPQTDKDTDCRICELIEHIYECYGISGKEDELNNLQTKLRDIISELFTQDGEYKKLFNKDVIQKLRNFTNNSKDVSELLNQFDGFVGYFDNYFDNRKNMYVAKEQTTAIAYRVVNQNLARFMDNIKIFNKFCESSESIHLDEVYSAFEDCLNVANLYELFDIKNYVNCVRQEDIKVYNDVIGGRVIEGESVQLKGLNQYINLYNKNRPKTERLPLFKPLYKQILSDRVRLSWLPNEYKSDAEMLKAIDLFCTYSSDKVDELNFLLQDIKNYDLDGIFINNDDLAIISQRLFGGYSVIGMSIQKKWKEENAKKNRETDEKYETRCKDYLKKIPAFSISYINECIGSDITGYFINTLLQKEDGENSNIFDELKKKHLASSTLLAKAVDENIEIINNEDYIATIKDLLDAYKTIQRFVAPLAVSENLPSMNGEFYNKFENIMEKLNKVTPLYNMVRNRLTRKPYKDDKFQLFFDNNSKLLNGWTDSKTNSDNGTQYGGYLFRKKNKIDEYDYYLGVSSDTHLFRSFNVVDEDDKSEYERLDYYQLKAQTFFGGCYSTAVGHAFIVDKNTVCGYLEKYVRNNGNEKIKTAVIYESNKDISIRKTSTPSKFLTLIGSKDPDCYNALRKDSRFLTIEKTIISNIQTTMKSVAITSLQKNADKCYQSIESIMDIVDNCCKSDKAYQYFNVSQTEMDQALARDNKRLYLFKITNKDLSYADNAHQRKSRGTDNLHTMYFKSLMEGGHSVYDIGTGTIYYRRKTEGLRKNTPTHPKNIPIKNKNKFTIKNKPTSTFDYDIQKDDRYTRDAFKLHLSIKVNYSKGNPDENGINTQVLNAIRNGDIRHIIGIDRGERNLLYITMVDMKGNLKYQESLNIISNSKNTTDYQQLLADRMKERDKNRKNWKRLDDIKNLKQGYLSQVVHKLATMIIEHDAIVVLENLNGGFIRERQCIEKQVYQQFEKALIEKLCFYVDKSKEAEELGGVNHPLQLTYPYKNNMSTNGQNGVIFYIPAWNTSKLDPVTGFVNLFNLNLDTIKDAQDFFKKFKSISYNKNKDYFEFSFDYSNFTNKADGTRTEWTLCTQGERNLNYRDTNNNSEWKNTKNFNLTDRFMYFFNKNNINIFNNLQQQICERNDRKFFYGDSEEKEVLSKLGLIHLYKLLLQMRNSITGTDVDYLISPVADENGNFYDSRNGIETLPKDADANGAYNIARKGLWVIDKIKGSQDGDKLNLAITNKEWLQYAQQKPYLND
ncbi:MAG: type V CRISPR-associated protein Cas12a/Cpf1 [Bacteroidaceae bacterium]|nr:type V CRISPR-associated protein Cas12a/Cpf1 [Bacteroidaceae bacterium]